MMIQSIRSFCCDAICYNMIIVLLGPEYGTTAASWKGCLTEAESLADVHLHIRDQLVGHDQVQAKVKDWKNEHFHKNMLGSTKETKELDDGFKKVIEM